MNQYTVDYRHEGENGSARVLATVTETETGRVVDEPVVATHATLRDAAARLARLMPGAPVADVERELAGALDGTDTFQATPLGEMWASDPHLREPVIDGVLRRGQVGNIISTSKSYKTYLILNLAAVTALGRLWLERFPTVGGHVLLIDLELQKPDIARRTHDIVRAMHADPATVGSRLHVIPLRGRQATVDHLERWLLSVPPRTYSLVIIDPLYKTYPANFDGNSNPQMTMLYRRFERLAEHLDCGLIVVHHASKGSQSDKSVVDVGAGAGAQARSPDAHMVIRPHQADNAVVLDARVRSFPPIDPLVLTWEYPLWRRDLGLDPAALKTGRAGRSKDKAQPQPKRRGAVGAQGPRPSRGSRGGPADPPLHVQGRQQSLLRQQATNTARHLCVCVKHSPHTPRRRASRPGGGCFTHTQTLQTQGKEGPPMTKPKAFMVSAVERAVAEVSRARGGPVEMFIDAEWVAGEAGHIDLFRQFSAAAGKSIELTEGLAFVATGPIGVYSIPRRHVPAFVAFLEMVLVATPDGGFVVPVVHAPGTLPRESFIDDSAARLAERIHIIRPVKWAPDHPTTVAKRMQLRAMGHTLPAESTQPGRN